MEDLVASANPDPDFWRGRRVLLTGHTGFKGAWATIWLKRMGASVSGLALAPDTTPNLWKEVGNGLLRKEYIADLMDRRAVEDAVRESEPEIVIHMAAQALVRPSYAQPVDTFATNIMGTVHLLEALRPIDGFKCGLMVTTDKVYRNNEQGRDFVEDDPLGGHDPYSASKAATELVTASYAGSFFEERGVSIATARAGNVIGGGDWAEDRLIPDVWRAAESGTVLRLRNPDATRPWQHVIDALGGYFLYVESMMQGRKPPRALNFGPAPERTATVSEIAEAMAEALEIDHLWQADEQPNPREMALLSLDPARARESLGWRTRLSSHDAVTWSAQWYAAMKRGEDPLLLCQNQISEYEALQ